MPLLILLRHAKAVRSAPGGDHARPLDASGQQAAAAAGRALVPWLPVDAMVVASDALRTRQTAALAFPTLPADRMRLEPRLYEAEPETLLAVLRGTPQGCPGLVLVGHNPGIGALAALLAAEGPAADLARLAKGLGTADAVVLRLDADWAEAAAQGCHLLALLPGRA